MPPDTLVPKDPTAMYLLTAVVLAVVGLVIWVVKFTLGRFADGQDKIVENIQNLTGMIAKVIERIPQDAAKRD